MTSAQTLPAPPVRAGRPPANPGRPGSPGSGPPTGRPHSGSPGTGRETPADFAIWLRQQRRARGLTQAALAALVGTKRETFSRWETGNYLPAAPFRISLARVFADTAPTVPDGVSLVPGWECQRAPGGCACRCHLIAAGRRAGTRGVPKTAWQPAEVVYARAALRRGDLPEEVAEYLTKTYGRYRSRRAVVHRAVAEGWSFRRGWYSEAEVARMLGANHVRVKRWREAGLLPAVRHTGRITGQPSRWWRFEEADLVAFVVRYAGCGVNPAVIRDRALKAKAEVAAAVNTRHREAR